MNMTSTTDVDLHKLREDLHCLLAKIDQAVRIQVAAEKSESRAEYDLMPLDAKLREERDRLHSQSQQVHDMLVQTQQLQRRLVQEKNRLCSHLQRREQALAEGWQNFDAHVRERIEAERLKLEARHAKQAGDIEKYQQLKSDAEARLASLQTPATMADAEALEVTAPASETGQDGTLELIQRRKQVLAERKRLQNEAESLASRLAETQQEEQASASAVDALQAEAKTVQSLPDRLQRHSWENQLEAAKNRQHVAARAHSAALAAQEVNDAALTQTDAKETEVLHDMNAEVEAWMQEQAAAKPSTEQQSLITAYEEAMLRLKQEEAQAEEQNRTHDHLLFSEIDVELQALAEKRAKGEF
ncbi:MAG: hypothetical protein WD572_03190 [Gammaproteobacteria bacterium]